MLNEKIAPRVRTGAIDRNPVEFPQRRLGIGAKVPLMLLDGFHAD